ncbi:MAG: tail fiber domain-containing protein, partial [Candidatus Pacebacteria bacterium]|nr:tail fiber domain-containing protein [Candidatus Paceibacterota bacterium]
IAQEVLPVFPELVNLLPNGYYTLDYNKLTPVLVSSIQELNDRSIGVQTLGASASTTPSITIDVNGNVGIGTTTPNHTLTVAGDIGAIAFVNTSTRDAKMDISYIATTTADNMLNKLVQMKVATYRYTLESQADPLRLGFIAEDAATIAPEILSPDGKGVDLYKIATFNLAATQALAARFDLVETRVASLESRLAALESGAVGMSTSSPLSFSSSTLASALESISSVLHIKQLVSDTFYAARSFVDRLTTANLTVGSSTAPAGVTFYDKVTKAPYCFAIENGTPTTTPGACADNTETVNPFATSTPSVISGSQTSNASSGSLTSSTSTPLTITLNGATPTRLLVGEIYLELGAVVTGGTGGAAPYQIFVDGAPDPVATPVLDTSAPTTYILTYHAINGAGETATAYRSVIVSTPDSLTNTLQTMTTASTTSTSSPITIVDTTATSTTTATTTATTTPSF